MDPGGIVFCSGCSLQLDEDPDAELGTRAPCPDCGTTIRYVRYPGADVQMSVGSKAMKRPGEKRPSTESIMGDSLQRSTGKWMRIHRIIDRRRNTYYEKVHDPATREVLREVEEPLTDHRGRGSAKRS